MNAFLQLRVADLQAAQAMVVDSWHRRALPPSDQVTLGRIFTPLAVVMAGNVALTLTTRNGRKRFLEVSEAILASILLAALLLAVLGMPIGAVYLVLKATAYFLRALLGLPVISAIAAPLRDKLIS